MRIAILSDIHGNLPALEAVVADLERQSPDEIWCGGDIAWSGPWATECIAFVRTQGWPTVKGNTDAWIAGDVPGVTEDERADVDAFARAHDVSEDDSLWLAGLPIGHSGPGSLLLVHATPRSVFDAPLPDAPAADFAAYENAATLVVYGHVHRAFVRRLTGGTLVCNTGSVGLPMDGELASYALVDRNGPELTVRHRRVAFDRADTARRARARGGPVADHFVATLEQSP